MAALPELTELVLMNSTKAQEEVILRRVQATPWSRGKDLDSYRKEDEETNRGPWAADHGFLQWVLVKRDDTEGEVFASCETFRRKAFTKPAGKKEVEASAVYGIASVFTADKHRKRGYATHMLRLLHLRLAPPLSYESLPEPFNRPPPPLAPEIQAALPRASFSILWSDVGATFYEKVTIPCSGGTTRPGWITHPGSCDTAVRWKPDNEKASGKQNEWSWILFEDLEALGEELAKDIKAELESRPVNDTKSTTKYDFTSKGLLQWLPERARRKENLEHPYVEPIGARIPRSGAKDSIILFAPQFFEKSELSLSLVHNAAEADVAAMLPVLAAALKIHHCDQVVAWGLGDELVRAFEAAGGKNERRKEINGHLLGVAVYAEGECELESGQSVLWC